MRIRPILTILWLVSPLLPDSVGWLMYELIGSRFLNPSLVKLSDIKWVKLCRIKYTGQYKALMIMSLGYKEVHNFNSNLKMSILKHHKQPPPYYIYYLATQYVIWMYTLQKDLFRYCAELIAEHHNLWSYIFCFTQVDWKCSREF